jgi:hypothetical protein
MGREDRPAQSVVAPRLILPCRRRRWEAHSTETAVRVGGQRAVLAEFRGDILLYLIRVTLSIELFDPEARAPIAQTRNCVTGVTSPDVRSGCGPAQHRLGGP